MPSPASYITVHVILDICPLTYNANVAPRKQTLKRGELDPKTLGNSQGALHLCLDRIKKAKDENELRRLTEELQRIVFHRPYQNAEN